MKPVTIFLIVLYLAIFSVGGYFLYQKYYKNVTDSSKTNDTIKLMPDKTIFYSVNNNLYQLNSDLLNKTAKDIGTYRLQSTGQVQLLDISGSNDYLVYEVLTPEKNSEIWQVNLKDNSAEKLFSDQTSGLENFNSFRSPHISPDEKYLAFLASNNGLDQIFVYEIESKNLTNLSYDTYQGQISSFDWSIDSSKLYFSAPTDDKSTIKLINLEKASQNLWEGSQIINKLILSKDKLIVLFSENQTANLGYINLSNPDQINPITDLKTPKKVVNYQVDRDNQQLVYQIYDTESKTNDIYISKTDGTNILQITTDGKSQFPVFSPDSKKIAFWVENSGIYTIDTSKQNKQKILNSEEKINNILTWNQEKNGRKQKSTTCQKRQKA